MLMNQDLEQSSLTDSPMTDRQKKKIVGRPKTSASDDDDDDEHKSHDVPIPFLGGIMGSGKTKPSEQEKIFAPRKADVLLGRGKPFQSHVGNQRMLCLVDEYRNRYLQAERREKHAIVESVMKTIGDSGGRFLIRVDYENYWVEVAHSIAYRKVGHAFRSKARRKETNTGSMDGPSILGDVAAATSSSLGGPMGYTSSMMTSGNLAAAQLMATSHHQQQNDLLHFGGGLSQSLPSRRNSALRLPVDSPEVSTSASHLQLLGVRGMNSSHHSPQNPSFASLPLQGPYASGDIGPRIPFPSPRLAAMGGIQLPFAGQGSGTGLGSPTASLPGAAGVSNFGSAIGGVGGGGGGFGLPGNAVSYDPSASLILRQRQQQQMLAQQEELIRQEQATLRAKLARVQFLESLRRQQQQHERNQRNQNL